jgi:hypothetical protein
MSAPLRRVTGALTLRCVSRLVYAFLLVSDISSLPFPVPVPAIVPSRVPSAVVPVQVFQECHPNTCPLGDRCGNQRFQKRQLADVKVKYVENTGHGFYSTGAGLAEGQLVYEYYGEVIDDKEYNARQEVSSRRRRRRRRPAGPCSRPAPPSTSPLTADPARNCNCNILPLTVGLPRSLACRHDSCTSTRSTSTS